MTTALLVLAALLVGFLAYRLAKLPAALAARPQPLMEAPRPEPLKATSHRVFRGPLEYNEHGFITTPLDPCEDRECHCRKQFPPTP